MGWRFLGTEVAAAATTDAYLDAIVTLFAKATYNDGSPRVPGAGYAWILDSEEGAPREAICFRGPTGCGHSARVIIAGINAAKAPPMMSPDTWLANILLSGTGFDGTLTTWDGATPLGPGIRFTGYARCSVTLVGAASNVWAWESKKGIIVAVRNGANYSLLHQGAHIRPWLGNGPPNSEADGHLYGGGVSGSVSALVVTETFPADYNPFGHSATNGRNHLFVLQPGAAGVFYLNTCYTARDNGYVGGSQHIGRLLGGEAARLQVPLYWSHAAYCDAGYLHDMGWVARDVLANTRYEGANPSYYTLATTTAAPGYAMGLFHDDVE